MVKTGGHALYRYSPSLVAAIIAIIAFAILTLLHTYRMIKSKLWFCLPFTIGGLCEYTRPCNNPSGPRIRSAIS